jgi:ribosomal protein L37AE/L43A
MGVPYVISIPGTGTTSSQLYEICNDYFKYLWDKSPEETGHKQTNPLPNDLAALRGRLLSFKKPCSAKFKIKLERSAFSKTMRFKPIESAPWIAKRNVYAILNSEHLGEEVFNWPLLRRQTKTSATMPVNRSCATLCQCMHLFMNEEILDSKNLWHCTKCDKSVAAKSQTALWKLPKIMVIQFKRFFLDGLMIIKNDTFVKYPVILDMKEFYSGPGDGGRYRLVAVTTHQGSLTGGHYEAKCFVEGPNKWYNFSDAAVKEIQEQCAISPNAYMLFYQHIE